MEEKESKNLMKMMWLSSSLVWLCFLFNLTILLSLWFGGEILTNITIFFMVFLPGMVFWQKWDKKIKPLI